MVCFAIVGPYIIQYSSMLNAIHYKGYFKTAKSKNLGCLRRIYLYTAFTFIGLLIMPLIDLMLKLEAIVKVLSIACICQKRVRNEAMVKPLGRIVQQKIE